MIVEAACPMPMFAPAEIEIDPFEPFSEVTTFVAAGAGTEIVTLPFPTPTEAIPAPEKFRRLVNVPDELEVVFPRAVSDFDTVWTDAEIVMVDAACPIPIPAPAEMEILPLDPFKEVTTLVAAGAGTEIVTLPLPTPTEAIPAPEKLRRLVKVPEELEVVFPRAVKDTEAVWIAGAGTEIVRLPAPAPMLTIPAPDTFNRFENVPEELTVVFPRAVIDANDVCTEAEIVIVLAPWPMPMPAPAEIDKLPFDPLRDVTTFVAAGAGTDRVTVPPLAFVTPDIERMPATLIMMLLPVKAVALFPASVVVFPLKLIPVKFDVPEYETLMLDAPELKAIPLPATRDTLDDVPFKEKLVAVGGAGTDKVTVPPLAFVVADKDKIPAALKIMLFPVSAVALFPTAVVVFPLRLIPVKLDVPEYDIVMLLAPELKASPPPAIRDTLLDVPFRLKFVATGTFADTVMFGLVDN